MQGAWDHPWQIFRTQNESVVRYPRSVVPTSYLETQRSKCFSKGRDDDRGERVGGCVKSVGVEWSKGVSYCSACQTQSAAGRDQRQRPTESDAEGWEGTDQECRKFW